jgi:metal-responsive CopG/Arc/MetJ family transcriptional regulator
MKVKTSITLSEDIISTIDQLAKDGESRSEAIERLLRERIAEQARQQRERRDLELINKNADELNEEAQDVLKYQVEL